MKDNMNMDMNMNGDSYGSENEYNSEYDFEYEEELEYRREISERAEILRKEEEERKKIEDDKKQAEKLKNELHIVTPFLNWAKIQNKVVIEKLIFEDCDAGWTQIKKKMKNNKIEEDEIIKKNIDTTKTEICKYTLNKKKCEHKTCRYAHSIIELNVVECNYGSDCRSVRFNSHSCKYSNDMRKDKVCMRKHPKETKENFYSRVNKSIPVTEEEMNLAYNCITEFENKNADLIGDYRRKAIFLPSNKSIDYIISTPYYSVKVCEYGILPAIEEKKVVKKVVKVNYNKFNKFNKFNNNLNKTEYKPIQTVETKNKEKINKNETEIQEIQEKIKNNNVIFDRFYERVDNVACQKHCEKIKKENTKLTSDINNLLLQIENIENQPKVEKKADNIISKKVVIDVQEEKKVEVKKFDVNKSFKSALNVISNEPSRYCCNHTVEQKIEVNEVNKTKTEMCKSYGKYICPLAEKFDVNKSFKSALNVISNEPSQYCYNHTVEQKIEVNEVNKTKTEMCKSYGKYICPLAEKCRFAHTFDELKILSCYYGNKCFDVEYSSGEYLNRNNMKNRICNKKHAGESIENVHKRIGYNKIIVNKIITPTVITKSNIIIKEFVDKNKTVICNSVLNKYKCKMDKDCKFAHSSKELKVLQCAYGDNCFDVILCSGVYINKNNTRRICNRKHLTETTTNVYKRLGL